MLQDVPRLRRRLRYTVVLLIALVSANMAVLGWWLFRDPLARPEKQSSKQVARTEMLKQLRTDSNAFVFIGDSHWEYFPLAGTFPDRPVQNRGIAGITSTELNRHALDLCGPRPSAVFIEIGANNIFQHQPIAVFKSDIRTLLNGLQERFPQARIILHTIPPTLDKGLDHAVRAHNEVLAACAREFSIELLDLDPHFRTGSTMDPAITYDGVHLNAEGYQRWAALLKPYIDGHEKGGTPTP